MGLSEVSAAIWAGVITTAIGHPLDTIKVHLQTNPLLTSTTDAAKSLIRERALYRGIVPPLANAIAMNTVMFSVFSSVKDGIGENTLQSAVLAGMVSGCATACISTPTDFVKIQAQLKGLRSWDILTSTSVVHLFRGHLANVGRESVFTMVYLGFYDQLSPQGFWQIAAASSLTGGLAWIISYPFDTIKTVIQSSSILTYQQALRKIGGSYYRGCLASTGRAVLVTSLRMIVYEAFLTRT
jgi:solute carrier family 25 (mitochondrial carnitine/acylcarnitine transporter), member 20/29